MYKLRNTDSICNNAKTPACGVDKAYVLCFPLCFLISNTFVVNRRLFSIILPNLPKIAYMCFVT